MGLLPLLVAGVGMGAGVGTVAGPYCVKDQDVFTPGAAINAGRKVFTPGAVDADVYKPGAVDRNVC